MKKWDWLKTQWQKLLLSMKGLVFPLWRLHPLTYRLGSRDERIRAETFENLLKMGEPAIPIFIQALTAPTSQILVPGWDGKIARNLAVEGLAKLKAKEAVEIMFRFLDNKDKDFVKGVIGALGEIGDPKAISVLIPFLGDWGEIGKEASASLQKLGAGEIINAFQSLIYERDAAALKTLRLYRKQVIKALKRILEQLYLVLPIVFSQGDSFTAPFLLSWQQTADIDRMTLLALTISEAEQMSRERRRQMSNALVNAVWALGEFGAVEELQIVEALAKRNELPTSVKEEVQKVAEKLRLLSTLPSIPDLSTLSTQNLPTFPEPTPFTVDSLPRPAREDLTEKRVHDGGK